MNLKEKIKNLWKNYKKHHLIFLSGFIAGIFILNWMMFFLGVVDFELPFVFTIFVTLLIIFAYLVSIAKIQLIVAKIVYIGLIGFCVGVFIWFITGYVLIQAPWAPLRILIGDPVFRGRILLSLLVPACGLGAFLGHLVGKKRNWKTIFTQKTGNY